MQPVNCVAIVSGGMDSVTLLHYLVKTLSKTPAVITFDYNQKHSVEIECAKYHTSSLNLQHLILDVKNITRDLFSSSALTNPEINVPHIDTVMGDPQPPTYVPNRNMIFLSLAAAYAETHNVNAIYYGAQIHDIYGYWDTTTEFVSAINSVMSLNRKNPIQIEAPFVSYSKSDILKIGMSIGVNYTQTWSCYNGDRINGACGTCPTCAERLYAFKNVGVTDPVLYRKAN
jgi:7-cyano-7-deazaguanine synthase